MIETTTATLPAAERPPPRSTTIPSTPSGSTRVATPVVGDGLAFVTAGYPPVLYRGILYTCNNNGILTAYRAETGEQLSMIRLSAAGASFAASPIAADGRLYVASETGDVYVLRAGPEPELLATYPMGETVMSTPAMSGGLLVVRTLNHIYGLAQTPAGERKAP